MYYYRIADIVLQSCYGLRSFEEFACEEAEADVTLKATDELPPPGEEKHSGTIAHRLIHDEWYIHPYPPKGTGLYMSRDYRRLRMHGAEGPVLSGETEWLVRIALECRLAYHGCVTLHSAAVEADGEAYAFAGPSCVGKSTRASAWVSTGRAKLINGDRPLINAAKTELYGVPWDGKEQCFRNVRYPLKAICEVRRSDSVYVRNLDFSQRRKLLMRQCFLPMWDTETAVVQMGNIARLAATANIIRVFCGPMPEDVLALHSAIQKNQILKEEPDMKAKAGFVLRNVVDEFILMPTGDNIGNFNGTILLNEVSAFVWEKLQNPMSRDDLLQAVLNEFEVDRATASADLDELLKTLRGYGVIEDD